MRWTLLLATLLVLAPAAPARAQADELDLPQGGTSMPALPDLEQLKGLPAMPAPNLSKGQMDALKRGLDASPKTPNRAAMMGKLLKLAMAMKNKQAVDPMELLPLVAYLRETNAAKKGDPAFEGALNQLEAGIAKIRGNADSEDMKALFKEFEGY